MERLTKGYTKWKKKKKEIKTNTKFDIQKKLRNTKMGANNIYSKFAHNLLKWNKFRFKELAFCFSSFILFAKQFPIFPINESAAVTCAGNATNCILFITNYGLKTGG